MSAVSSPVGVSSPASSKKIIEFIKRGLQPPKAVRKDGARSDASEEEEEEEEDDETLPFTMGYLTPKMQEEAIYKLKETEESKENSLQALRKLIQQEKDLVCRMDENFLLQFLRARKYNIKKAFKLLQNYYAFRKEYRHVIDTADTEKVSRAIFRNFIGLLKRRDKNGSVVFIAKIGIWDPEEDTFEDLFRAVTACLVYAIEDPATQVTGFRVIIDARNLSWKQMKYCTPQNALLVIRSTQFCFPARYKGVHILNANKLFALAWSMIYPFLTTKLKKRIHIHGEDLSALQDYISPLVLPFEYGGLGGTFDNADWEDIIKRAEKLLRDMMTYGYK